MSIPSRNPIRLLDERTINQIAAGEVIENPSSVVKELLENAIDAGAHSVAIETQGGGRGLIRITDDGCGMDQDDLLLCLERHATSKITELDDLNTIASLGFRGEALPSIASVSKMTLHSASIRNPGTCLFVEGGKIMGTKTSPRNQGTTIEVKSLFYNVPVRKKFQKSVAADTIEIQKVLTKAALCHPTIGMTWIHDGKTQFSFTDQNDLESRISALLGDEYSTHFIPISNSEEELSLSGFFSHPSFHRPNRTGQYLFLNARAVVSPFVAARILEGYSTRLPTNRFPLFVLHMGLPADWIDVNVHPQKREVRIRNEEQIASFLIRTIEKRLQEVSSTSQSLLFSIPPQRNDPILDFEMEELPLQFIEKSIEIPPLCEAPAHYHAKQEPLFFKPTYQVLKVFGGYLLAENDQGLFIVHVRAAYSRIVFEQKKNHRPIAVQQLLIPLNLEFAGSEQRLLLEKLDEINKLGISIRHFGGNTFVVDALPQLFDIDEIPNLLHKLLEGDPLLQMSLVAKKKVHSPEEGYRLLERLFECQMPHETPDGRPTYFYLTEDDLLQRFKR